MVDKLNKLKLHYGKQQALRDSLVKEINESKEKTLVLEQSNLELEKAIKLINKSSLTAKKKIIGCIESLVTEALVYISGRDYKFKIDIDETLKTPKCEFMIENEIDGIVNSQRLKDACGGGFVDIVQVSLRYIFLELIHDPKSKGFVMLDEPGKMLSSDMAARFGEFIKKMGKDYNRQTIMITHNEALLSIGDLSYKVTNIGGKSKVDKYDISKLKLEQNIDVAI